MKNIESNKRIDVIKTNITPLAIFKQGDKGVLILELFRNGTPFDITGQTITLGAYRPNQTVVEQIDGFNINNNILTINFKNSIFALPGLVELDLELTDTEGEMTTSSFYIKVNKKVLGDDNLNASDEFNSLKQLKIDLTALNEKASRDENTRITNERLRASAEIERQDFYENTAKPTLESLKDFDSQITENTNQINKAKTGFDGKEHSSLKRRLDADFTEVKEQFNANAYLPYEGENITIENSLDGVTKDMILKGRTLQNIIPKGFNSWKLIHQSFSIENNKINMIGTNGYPSLVYKDFTFKSNTIYTLIVNVLRLDDIRQSDWCILRVGEGDGKPNVTVTNPTTTGLYVTKFTTLENTPVDVQTFLRKEAEGKMVVLSDLIILKGDWTNKKIPPYFEGIKSVAESEDNKISNLSIGKNLVENKFILNRTLASDGTTAVDYYADRFTTEEYSIINIGDYIISCSQNFNGVYVAEYDCNKKFIVRTFISQGNKFIINNTKTRYIRLSILGVTDFENLTLQVEKGSVRTSFQPYQRDKKEILLPIEDGLKGLPNGASDKIYEKDWKVLLEQNIDKLIASGNNDLTWLVKDDNENTILFYIDGASMSNVFNRGSDLICNSFSNISDTWNSDIEGINIDGYCSLQIRILKTKLETQDILGFKKWLQANPVTVYYQLAEPIVTELPISSIEFRTYLEKTHLMSLNKISSTLSFKAPVDIPATISTLRNKNEALELENKELKEEVDNKTLKLHGQDVELTNSDLDLDFRIFELELNIGIQLNLNMKGMRNMARSPYEMMKILILNNNYDREDIEYKAKRYLQGGRMTQAEYDEIISLMDANELVK